MACVFPGNRWQKQRKKKYHFLSTENKLCYEAFQLAFFPPLQVPDHEMQLFMILLLGNDKKDEKMLGQPSRSVLWAGFLHCESSMAMLEDMQ